MAPVQRDLNHLVKCAFGPEDAAHLPSATGIQETQRFHKAVEIIAQPNLAHPGGRNLLVGCAILLKEVIWQEEAGN
jgi:hypothetical protein